VSPSVDIRLLVLSDGQRLAEVHLVIQAVIPVVSQSLPAVRTVNGLRGLYLSRKIMGHVSFHEAAEGILSLVE